MTTKSFFRTVTLLALGGTLFAGWLSFTKLLTGTCALNEPCPYVLGYPACWYGLAMFATMLAAATFGLLGKTARLTTVRFIATVAAAGTAFAGWLTLGEFSGGFGTYTLGLPSCAYGLVFYIAVLALCIAELRRAPVSAPLAP